MLVFVLIFPSEMDLTQDMVKVSRQGSARKWLLLSKLNLMTTIRSILTMNL